MKIIGICGSSGSGKSTVCQLLSKRGAKVLDCDRIYHDLVSHPSPCLEAIGARFGADLTRGGSLDRAALRRIVFSDPAALAELNTISHHYVKEALKNQLSVLVSEGCGLAVIDAPMFFEAGLEKWCDLVCAVVATPELQLQRICQRDQIAPEQAMERLNNQIPPEVLREKADYVIENRGDMVKLQAQCDRLIKIARSNHNDNEIHN